MNKLKTLAAILCPWWIVYRQNRVIEKQKGKIDALCDVLANPRIVGMAAAENQVKIGLKGPMVELVAAVLEGLIEGCPEAENYLEMQGHSPKGRFVVIITRPCTGLTPHQLRRNAEHKAERLEKENVKLRHALQSDKTGEWEGQSCSP